jgi:serine O-acetyltransferase
MLDALAFQRFAHRLHRRGFRRAARVAVRVLRHVFAAYLPAELELDATVELGYGALGVVIHPEVRIGRGVLLSPGVVIGGRSDFDGLPVIGDHVRIGAGAKILGPVKIGDGARVGANAVVLSDVAAGETVVGVPARPIRLARQAIAG